jgi:hypothetical protein
MIHKTCGQDLQPRIACGCCNEIVKPRDLALTPFSPTPTKRHGRPHSQR